MDKRKLVKFYKTHKMKSTFTINEQKKIITEILAADITNDEYIKLKHDEFHHKKFNRNYNLISDFRKCDKNFDSSDLQVMVDIFKENKGKVNRKKSALIVSDLNCLRGINLKTNNTDTLQEIQYFTDIDEAEKWLLS